MKETEITVEVFNTPEEITDILTQQGFRVVRKVDMIDYYYSKEPIEQLKNFEYRDLMKSSILIRQLKSNNTKNLIIFKDKNLDNNGNVISEEKVNCSIDDIDNAIKIFNLAGLNCWCNLIQHMSIFQKGNIEFAVQDVEGLGVFIEYEEDETMKNLSPEAKIQLMLKTLNNLGLKIGDDFSCKKPFLKFKKS